MKCPKCGSENVNIQMIQEGATSKTRNKGCLYSLGRGLLILCTLGLWCIFGKKKSKTKTTFKNKKVAVCQNCGNEWDV